MRLPICCNKGTLESARARERGAYGELAICIGGGIFSVTKAFAYNDASWQAPQQTKDMIAPAEAYLQEGKEFEKLFEQARAICLP